MNNANAACVISSHLFAPPCTAVRVTRLALRKWSNKRQSAARGPAGPVAREIDRAHLKCTAAEAHRNYRESVSRISRAHPPHTRETARAAAVAAVAAAASGSRRLSDYLNATICMRRRRARVTDELRSQRLLPADGESRCVPRAPMII